jgi:hypothetical protein
MTWTPTEDGHSIGTKGFDGGTLVADYEHGLGARISIEDLGDGGHFAITCGIYDWLVHTRFLTLSRADADAACAEMRTALEAIMDSIPLKVDPERDAKCEAVSVSIAQFVDRFP